MRSTIALLTGAALMAGSISAAPLTEAKINKIINEVALVDPTSGARPATLNDVIKDQLGVKTGIKSRSELMFQDETLTRIGPESFFSFKPGTREISLQQGTMLLQVPKGLGGTKVHTAAVTAAITGTTIMLENIPGKDVKVLVLEGSLRLSINGVLGDSLLLLPGKMVIMPPNAKRIPEPVAVDLAHIMKTSALVKMGQKSKPLPSTGLIQAEIERQSESKVARALVATNLVIVGSGTQAMLASTEVLSALDRKDGVKEIMLASNEHASTSTPTPAPVTTPAPTPTPVPLITPTPLPSATPIPTATPKPTATPGPTVTPSPTATPKPTTTPRPTATPTPSATPPDDDDHDHDHDHDHEGGDKKKDDKSDSKESRGAGIRAPRDLATKSPSSQAKTGPVAARAISVNSSGDLLALVNDATPEADGSIKFSSTAAKEKVNKNQPGASSVAGPSSRGTGLTRGKPSTVRVPKPAPIAPSLEQASRSER